MLMTQMFPVGEEGAVRARSPLLGLLPCLPVLASTFGDDPAIRKQDVLGTAAGDGRDWGVQAQTLLDAHGQEGQLGQVIPKEPHNS